MSRHVAKADRERAQVGGHVSQLGQELEAEQAQVLRLRVDVTRRTNEAEQAIARLTDEQRAHADTRRRHDATLAAHADVLAQVKEEQQKLQAALEARLRKLAEADRAALRMRWRGKYKRSRIEQAQGTALLHDQLREGEKRHASEAAEQARQHASALERREAELRAEADAQRDELRGRHERALTEALAAHAEAEKRTERYRAAEKETEARLQQDKAQAVALADAKWAEKLEALRHEHGRDLEVLRGHFEEQLALLQTGREDERVSASAAHNAALRRNTEELSAARAEAAQRDQEMRERHEREHVHLQARHVEALTALETRLAEKYDQALVVAASESRESLEELARAHTLSVEAVRRQSLEQLAALQASTAQELARREGEHQASRRRDAEELSTLRAQMARREQEMRERYEKELTLLETRHLEAITALESRLGAEQEQAIAATVSAWEAQLEQQRRQFQVEIAGAQTAHKRDLAEQDAGHQAVLANAAELLARVRGDADRGREELRQQHARAAEEARAERSDAEKATEREHRVQQRALDSKLRQEWAEAVEAVVAEWESKLEALRKEHASAIAALRTAHRQELAALQSSASEELMARDGAHRETQKRSEQQLAAARADAARLDSQTRERYELTLAEERANHRTLLAGSEAKRRAEAAELLSGTVAEWEQKTEELRREHSGAIDALCAKQQDQLDTLHAFRDEEMAKRDGEHAATLRRLREELGAARAQIAQLSEVPTAGQVSAEQAAALEALEQRLVRDQEEAVAASVAEWKAKIDRLRRGHADAMAAQRREHQDQIEALDRARAPPRLPASAPEDKVVSIKTATRDRS